MIQIIIAISHAAPLVSAFVAPSSTHNGRSGFKGRAFLLHPSKSYIRQPSTVLHANKNDDNTSNEESTIDPSNLYKHDSYYLPNSGDSQETSSWGVADDWSTLSSSSVSTPSFDYVNGNYDNVLNEAAQLLEEQESILSEWEDSEEVTPHNNHKKDISYVQNDNEDFVDGAIEVIASNMDYNEPDGVALYDTKKSSSPYSTTTMESKDDTAVKNVQKEEEEMAFMIRCNQSPEQFLISQGKALPELTNEVKYAPNFLLEESEEGAQQQMDEEAVLLPLQPKMTPFFKRAVERIFNVHSIEVVEEEKAVKVLDRQSLANWMTACLSSPYVDATHDSTTSSSDKQVVVSTSATKPQQSYNIGPHDPDISAVLSRYSQSHGSGRLTLDEFQTLYLEVAWSGYNRDIYHKKLILDPELYHQIPSIDAGRIVQGRKNTEKMLQRATLSLIWRDLEGHDIFSPAEEEQVELLKEMERLQSSIVTNTKGMKNEESLMDECELFDEYTDRLSHSVSSIDNEIDMLGVEYDFIGDIQKKEKSSHELVEMATDGKTPLRIRDGDFVFIDEESCIGCTQCAQIAPSSFKMIEESGRARTYNQMNDVENAVMVSTLRLDLFFVLSSNSI